MNKNFIITIALFSAGIALATLSFMRYENEAMAILPYVIGYLGAVVIAHFPIKFIVDELWKSVGTTSDDRPHPWHPHLVGILERILYVTFFLLGKPEFIGFWLALKGVGKWRRWSNNRYIFNIFLIGNALSVGYSIVGAKLIDWYSSGEWSFVIVVPISLLLATLFLWCVIKNYTSNRR